MQEFPSNNESITITNFTNSNYTGSPPSTLLYDFIYLSCSTKKCAPSGFNGWLQNTAKTDKFGTQLVMKSISWTDNNNDPHTITHGNHGQMRLSIDVDDHESNHTAGTNNWYVEVPAYAHAYVNVKSGESLNYRIKNSSGNDLTVKGYFLYYQYHFS